MSEAHGGGHESHGSSTAKVPSWMAGVPGALGSAAHSVTGIFQELLTGLLPGGRSSGGHDAH